MNNLVVSQQGISLSYHDIVRKELFPNSDMLGRDTFHEVVLDVEEGRADIGIMAVENSVHADTPAAQELRQNFEGLEIVGEAILDITHRLWGTPEGEIEEVWSHPVAISQCRKTLRNRLGDVLLVERPDTALAIQEAADLIESGFTNVAAVGSQLAGESHPALSELDSNVNDYENNETRFIVFQRVGEERAMGSLDDADKTTVRLTIPDENDSLLRTMQILSSYGINYTSLIANAFRYDSRDGRIVIPAEFTHAWHDNRLESAVEELKRMNVHVHNLGTYKSGKILKV